MRDPDNTEDAAMPAVAAPPGVQTGSEGAIRVACASDGGEALNGHFGACRWFLVYEVSASDCRLVDVREADDAQAEDKSAYRAALIADCQLLYVVSIGGPAAAKVVKVGTHPIKWPDGGSARERAAALQPVLAHLPPPWLAKAIGRPAEARVRFAHTRG